MNDPHEDIPEELIEQLLQPLRSAEPSAEVRLANRDAVHRALANMVRPTWWQRSIAVPIPVAIAASIVVLLATASLVRQSTDKRNNQQPQSSVIAQQADRLDTAGNTTSAESITPAWHIHRSFIRTLTAFPAGEIFASNNLENRDDS